jgi:hypothetical protein
MSEDGDIRIRIRWPRGAVTASLRRTPTTEQLLAVLPFAAAASTWGDEVYFSVPLVARAEPDARQVVDPGTVCYWPPGNALALPFGRTPISRANECRLASPCNVLGHIEGDARALHGVRAGDTIHVEPATARRT